MVTLYAFDTGIGITWETIAIDVGIAILFYILYRVLEKQGKDEGKYISFFIGASSFILMITACCSSMIMDKISSWL